MKSNYLFRVQVKKCIAAIERPVVNNIKQIYRGCFRKIIMVLVFFVRTFMGWLNNGLEYPGMMRNCGDCICRNLYLIIFKIIEFPVLNITSGHLDKFLPLPGSTVSKLWRRAPGRGQ